MWLGRWQPLYIAIYWAEGVNQRRVADESGLSEISVPDSDLERAVSKTREIHFAFLLSLPLPSELVSGNSTRRMSAGDAEGPTGAAASDAALGKEPLVSPILSAETPNSHCKCFYSKVLFQY